ncbi:uncharacterized protein [Coffea arabica]|uniref:Uncharacterized protein isoform X1 n=1 Tax=Coffea arabica TaxID=13443 RepID=A0A6P6XAT4_COFAR|nr:uncharacterized protein LOC113741533 [Coffea arabica]
MADQFSNSVELGLKLSKRIFYGKESSAPAPAVMERKSETNWPLLPTGPMVYAVISEPSMVDNPDIPSYQPYVHGRCEPPALIPLHMHGVAMEVDCYLDTAFITVTGTWRLHCVSASKSCDCRIAVPMGEKGSILGVQVECPLRSYSTQLTTLEEDREADKAKDGFLLKGHIYTLKIPQVDGGCTLSVRISWSQKLLCQNNQLCLKIPFTFPQYVTPVGKKVSKIEKILLNVNSGIAVEIFCNSSSHPLKQVSRQAEKLQFSYEREASMWSINDFSFIYSVSSNDIVGGVLLQSPPLHDFDQRDMFCFYLYPGNTNNRKVFRKEVIFVVDISASMRGDPLDKVKAAVLTALSKLNPADSFNIIAFNGLSLLFSSSMELATKEVIENASQWIANNVVADGSTNISLPLSQALKMMSKAGDLISLIFLITDGSVEDERDICAIVKHQAMEGGFNSPRINTLAIGSYCNHYFLQVLAEIGRGYYDAAYDMDSIDFRLERLFDQASSVILADLTIDCLEQLDSLELYPFQLPDLLSESPLLVSGRYTGKFPDSVKFRGTLADLENYVIDAKVQKAKDFPMERMFAKSQIDALTANAWLSEDKQLEEKVERMSLQMGVPSEYTNLVLVETKKEKQLSESSGKKIIVLRTVGAGFGSLKATAENVPPETAEPKLHETSEMITKAARNLCGRMLDCCCCMCFIQFCSRLNDQCAVVLTQLCTALACFGCMNFCCEVCFSCDFCG